MAESAMMKVSGFADAAGSGMRRGWRRLILILAASLASLGVSAAAYADRTEDFSDETGKCPFYGNNEVTLRASSTMGAFCTVSGGLLFSTSNSFGYIEVVDNNDTIKAITISGVDADSGQLWVESWGTTDSGFYVDNGQSGSYTFPAGTRRVNFVNKGNFGASAVTINSVTYSDPVDPVALYARVSGSPAPGAASIDVVYEFNTSVINVSADDFIVTTVTGDATGEITNVRALGYSNTITVGNLTGEGYIRVDLKSNTDIRNRANVGNPPSAFSSGDSHLLDRRAPAAPPAPVLDPSSDLGISSTDRITSSLRPVITGSAEANATVLIRGDLQGSTRASNDGNWSFTPASDLSTGTYAVHAVAQDAAGNESASSPTMTFTVSAGGEAMATFRRNTPAQEATPSEALLFTATFDEARFPHPINQASVQSSDLMLQGPGASGAVITNARFIGGRTLNVEVMARPYAEGALSVEFAPSHGFVDIAGANWRVTTPSASEAYRMDNTLPTLQSVTVEGSPAVTADAVTFRLTFSEDVNDLTIDDLNITLDHVTARADRIQPISSSVYDVRFIGIEGEGRLGVGLRANTDITDIAGNGNGVNGYVPAFTSGEEHQVDRVRPNAPPAPDLADGSDDGVSNTDNLTNRTRPTLVIFTTPGQVIEADSAVDGYLGEATANAGGVWAFTPSTDLTPNVTHSIVAIARDAAGNRSYPSVSLNLTIDTTRPTATLAGPVSFYVDGPIAMTATLPGDVSSPLEEADLTINNGYLTPGSLRAIGGGVYEFEVSPQRSGLVRIDILEQAFIDDAGNYNLSSSSIYTANPPRLTLRSSLTGTAPEGAGAVTLTAELGYALPEPVTLNLAYAGEATRNTDFTGPDTLVIPANARTGTVTLQLLDDAVDESDETLTVGVSSVTSAHSVSNQTQPIALTLSDDDASTLALSDVAVEEQDGQARVSARLSAPSSTPVTFSWSTQDGTATAPDDYAAVTNQAVTIPAGDTEVFLDVSLVDDDREEDAETFTVSLVPGAGVTVTQNVATITIGASDVSIPTAELDAPSGPFRDAFNVGVAFSEPVTGLDLDDFSTQNASLSDLQGSGDRYSVRVTPLASGQMTISLNAGAVVDEAGYASRASAPLVRQADMDRPSVSLALSDLEGHPGDFALTISFSEAVQGFASSSVALTNAELLSLTSSDQTVFVGQLHALSDGVITVRLPEGAARDAAGNASAASETVQASADLTAPTARLEGVGASLSGVTRVSLVFSEAVTGLDASDFVLSNLSLSGFAGEGERYAFDLTPERPGSASLALPQGVAQDASGNASEALSAQFEIVADAPPVDLLVDAETTQPGAIAAVAQFSNPGSTPLAFRSGADAGWLRVTPASGTIAPLGRSEVRIALTDAINDLPPGDYVATVQVRADIEGAAASAAASNRSRPRADAEEALLVEIPVHVTVEPRFGALTLVAAISGVALDETGFSYQSDIEAFNGLQLTPGGAQSSATVEKLLNGQYRISQSLPSGWRIESIACTGDLDHGAQIQEAAGELIVDLDAGESQVCTFTNARDEDAVRLATQRSIRTFMMHRADRLVQAAPDLSTRFEDRQTMSNGVFAADVDGSGRSSMQVSGSLSGWRNSAAQSAAEAPGRNPERPVLENWDVWFAAELSSVRDRRQETGADTDFAVAQLGVDYQIADPLILGWLVQYDHMSERQTELAEAAGALATPRVSGEGWMTGPYLVWRLEDDLVLDAQALYGRSDNRINPLGLYEDAFDTERFLLKADLTGAFSLGAVRVRPQLGLVHFEDSQRAYTDTLGILIPEQTVSLGRLQAGPDIAWRHDFQQGGWIELSSSVTALWDYRAMQNLNASGLYADQRNDLRADASVGLAALTPWGVWLRIEAGFDGLGVGDFEARTGRLEIRLPFGARGRAGGSATRSSSDASGLTECSAALNLRPELSRVGTC
jgi:hypothetical protein